MVSNPLSHVRSFYLAFFSSASTQTVLTRTVGSNRVQRSLAVDALNYKDHASVSYIYIQLTGHTTHSQGMVAEHDVESHDTCYLACILQLHPLLLVTRALRCGYVKIKSYALIALSRLSPHFLGRSQGMRLLNQGVTRH